MSKFPVDQIRERWQASDIISQHANFKTPVNVTMIIQELLRDHFRYSSKEFKYSSNKTESAIEVASNLEYNIDGYQEDFPGCFVRRGPWNYRQEGRVLGDVQKRLIPEEGYTYTFWVPVTAGYEILTLGLLEGEVDNILDEVAGFFTIFNEPIRKDVGFKEFLVTSVSPVSIYDQNKKYRVGTVSLKVVFDFVWALTLEKPLIQNVVFKKKVDTNNGCDN